ncbi:hypothetical protein ACXYUI_31610, partial [Klebsiella pneumoniae]
DGAEIHSETAPYAVQCEPHAELHSDDFKVIRCTFINKSANDVEIHNAKVSFSPDELDDKIAKPEAIAAYHDQLAKVGSPK